MDSKDKNEITNIELLESINRGFEKMASREDIEVVSSSIEQVKVDLLSFKLETHNHFNNLESDLKSFKSDTAESFAKLEKKSKIWKIQQKATTKG